MSNRLTLLLILTASATSLAGDKKPSVKVAADGTATIQVPRTMAEGTPLAALKLALPTGWKRSDPAQIEFGPKDGKLGHPTIEVDVALDNLDPKEVPDRAKASVKEIQTALGGGKITRLVTDVRPLELGPNGHGFMTTIEVDALEARHVEYAQTTCVVFKADGRFGLRITGRARIEDKAIATEFEKVCASARL